MNNEYKLIPVKVITGLSDNVDLSEVTIYLLDLKNELIVEGVKENVHFELINSIGQLVKQGLIEGGCINTSNLKSGVYLLCLKDKNNKNIAIRKVKLL